MPLVECFTLSMSSDIHLISSLLKLFNEYLAHILYHLLSTCSRPEIELQCPIEELQEHLEADLGDRRIISPFAQFVSDECIYHGFQVSRSVAIIAVQDRLTLRPRYLVEAEAHSFFV